jgi:hypothetical protein
MKALKVLLVAATSFTLAAPLWSQQVSRKPAGPEVLGYLDTDSGAFRPAVHPDIPEATLTTMTGKLQATFTISVLTAFPSGTSIICEFNASVADPVAGFITETSAVTAVRSGSTATCTPSIPYSWQLATPTTDSVSLSISVSAEHLSTTTPATAALRTMSRSLPTIKVPAHGAITKETVAATI